MYRTISLTIAAALMALQPTAVCAQDTIPTPTQDKTAGAEMVSASLVELNTLNDGTKLVSAAHKYCLAVRDAFPTNSPAEQSWLDKETSAGTKRQLRAMSSAEFGRAKAMEFTMLCDIYATKFKDGGGRKHNLVGIAHSFLRFSGDAENYAASNNVDSKSFAFSMLPFFAEMLLKAALFEAE